MQFLNAKRIRNYPRLMFLTTWTIVGMNLLLHNGWQGGLGQIIGSDFITLYGAGILHRTNPNILYDFTTQGEIQQNLITPTHLPGVNPYISPPYVAYAYSLFTYLPLPWAFLLWSVLALLFTALAVRWLVHLLPMHIRRAGLGYGQLLVLVLSFLPFIEGFQVGQNHTLTLLLVTGIMVCMLSEHWMAAGAMAGLLLYKPHFILGFLLLWLIWRQFKALLALSITALFWVGSFVLLHGTTSLASYLETSRTLILLPYFDGFPGYLLITVYGFLSSMLRLLPGEWFQPGSLQATRQIIYTISQGLFLVMGACLAWLAYRLRRQPIMTRTPAILLAMLWPLLTSPYALLHDMLILVSVFVLWARHASSRSLLNTIIVVYLGAFLLTLVAALIKIALMTVLMFWVTGSLIHWMVINWKTLPGTNLAG